MHETGRGTRRDSGEGETWRTGQARRGRRAGVAGTLLLHAAGIGALLILNASLPTPEAAAAAPAVLVLPPAPPDAPPALELPKARLPISRPTTPETFPAPREIEAPAPDRPAWIPHEVAPVLMNTADVVERLDRNYPEGLPADARSSRVVLWLFVDASGRVTRIQLRDSSGYPQLDALAQRAATTMEFRPALNARRTVGVWVAQPIRFAEGF